MILVDAETGAEAEAVVVDQQPVDDWTDGTSSSPPAPPPVNRFATGTNTPTTSTCQGQTWQFLAAARVTESCFNITLMRQ